MRLVGNPSLKLRRSTRTSLNVDLGASGLGSTTDGASRSIEGPVLAPTVVPSKENSAPASEAGATSFVAVLMRDVISSLRDVVVPAPEPAIPIVLPEAVPVENPPTSEVLDVIPLNAADPGVFELEASWTLEAVAIAAGTSSEAGTSGGRKLVSVPGIRSKSPMEGLLRPKEIQTFESPKLDPQTVATILEMNLRVASYTET
ncbi:uncharacterized protein LOC111257131 [Setaria italica]|uniref:uncharacterized protein LOC111257131 n=1 Tax=Setaria italica TaxID=4555 RepID=UPI000BE56040|nr:uncharacterized protein LOC111257131 [Setaria italica]